MAVTKIISQLLDTNGDGTGTTNAKVDGSSTPVVFKFAPTRNCRIHRMMVFVEDAGAVVAANYGAVAGPLTNGIIVTHTDDSGTVTNLHGQVAITNNADWARLCYDVTYSGFAAGNDFVHVRWTFDKTGIPLIMESGDTLKVTVRDNLTGLVEHYFHIQGHYI